MPAPPSLICVHLRDERSDAGDHLLFRDRYPPPTIEVVPCPLPKDHALVSVIVRVAQVGEILFLSVREVTAIAAIVVFHLVCHQHTSLK